MPCLKTRLLTWKVDHATDGAPLARRQLRQWQMLRDTGGAVRASIYHYTTGDEIDRLLAAVAELA